MNSRIGFFTALSLCLNAATFAHEPQVVPVAEQKKAQQLKAEGPRANAGIESVRELGRISLAGEIRDDSQKILRAREMVIEPGGLVAVHQHDSRPGVAYILEGEIVEHRNDASGPIIRKVGAVAFEKTGVVHWWENKSAKKVKALIVDVVPSDIK